ncbi:hypothetical protein [Glutamicibacter arilaitensis]|uniref:hypothetical protein n=1 Tax=Glutamicibacter arilaitensis TaxID=256701 RepID=UPI003F9A2139
MKIYKGLLNTVGVLLLMAIGGVLALATAHFYSNPFDLLSQKRNTEITHSLQREEQVVLLSLGVQEIENTSQDKTFFDFKIPGTTRTSHVQFSFDAKVGIEGEDVKVEEAGNNRYIVSIPEFIFIGHENLNVKLINEENGVLSWVTPDIDQNEMLQKVLSDELQDEHIEKNEDTLREQAPSFYKRIVEGIDPSATLEFKYS